MDSFPDGTHVWLWIREFDAYLYANEDGEGIDLSGNRGALHAAWAVHRLVRDGTDYVLFQSASYGRYLSEIVVEEAQSYRAVQCIYDSPEQENVLLQARKAEDESGDIIISNRRIGDWCHDYEGTPMHWVVEAIPPRLIPPELPVPPAPIPPLPIPVDSVRRHHRVNIQPPLRRTILYVRADNQGYYNPLQWRVLLQFEGQSVFNLRRDLAAALGEANNVLGITLCSWAGSNGRLTPLVIDLPSDEKTMNIVVLTTGSPAAQALVYPNIDAA